MLFSTANYICDRSFKVKYSKRWKRESLKSITTQTSCVPNFSFNLNFRYIPASIFTNLATLKKNKLPRFPGKTFFPLQNTLYLLTLCLCCPVYTWLVSWNIYIDVHLPNAAAARILRGEKVCIPMEKYTNIKNKWFREIGNVFSSLSITIHITHITTRVATSTKIWTLFLNVRNSKETFFS